MSAQDSWWIAFGFPAFERGKDLFPRPGQILSYYRKHTLRENGKHWTRKEVAVALGVSVWEIGNLENHDIGFTFERRCLLVQILDIDPRLFGVVRLEDVTQELQTITGEFKKQHIQPFEQSPDGFPRPGQALKHYRYWKKHENGSAWTQADLAYILGISEQTIRDMENRDKGFTFERRQFLAHLLAIPPALLGITTQEELLKASRVIHKTAQCPTIHTSKDVILDVAQCRQTLQVYQESNYTYGGQALMNSIYDWIALLRQELPHVKTETQKTERYELLIGYYRLTATILRDLQRFDDALLYANLAVKLAGHLNSDEHYAVALCRRGKILLDKANVLNDVQALHPARDDFQLALSLKERLPEPVISSILLNGGHAIARGARSEKERTQALHMMDQAGTIARKGKGEDQHAFKIDTGRYHIDKGDAFIALGRPGDAIRELSLIADNPLNRRRNAYRDVYLAQAYLKQKDFDEAASLAATALPALKEIHASISIERIVSIYNDLKKSPFHDTIEMAHLEWLLWQR
ncbi:MAG TPA: hypothetical protein VKR06_20225 [Ktedonosporobacter sp.]|nr:hypothetical protein [Ktedonosporobacter sp.]